MVAIIRRYPLPSFFVMAYGFSWGGYLLLSRLPADCRLAPAHCPDGRDLVTLWWLYAGAYGAAAVLLLAENARRSRKAC